MNGQPTPRLAQPRGSPLPLTAVQRHWAHNTNACSPSAPCSVQGSTTPSSARAAPRCSTAAPHSHMGEEKRKKASIQIINPKIRKNSKPRNRTVTDLGRCFPHAQPQLQPLPLALHLARRVHCPCSPRLRAAPRHYPELPQSRGHLLHLTPSRVINFPRSHTTAPQLLLVAQGGRKEGRHTLQAQTQLNHESEIRRNQKEKAREYPVLTSGGFPCAQGSSPGSPLRWSKPAAALSVGFRCFGAKGMLHDSWLKLLGELLGCKGVQPSANSGGRREQRKKKEERKRKK